MHKGEGANKLHIYKWHVQYPVGYATWLALPGPRDSNQLCGQVYQRQLTRKSGTRRWVSDHQVQQRTIKIPGNGRQSNTPHPVMTSTTNIWSNGQNNINIIMWVYSQNMHAFRDFYDKRSHIMTRGHGNYYDKRSHISLKTASIISKFIDGTFKIKF